MKQELLVVDSTVDGKFRCTVRKTARGSHLEGALCRIDVDAAGQKQAILGRIGLVSTTNLVHDNPALKALVMEDGRIPHFSGYADTETTIIEPVSCVDLETGKLAGRRANPSSGTPVSIVDADDIQMFLNEREHIAYVGFMPGYPEVALSIQNKDYGRVEDGGWGEAHHTVTAGQTGSGKTILALTCTLCKAVAHPSLGLLIPDTKGDIALDDHSRGAFKFSFLEGLRRGGRTYERLDVNDIRLESATLFAGRLSGIIRRLLSTNGEKAESLARAIADQCADAHDRISFEQITVEDFLSLLREEVEHGFQSNTAKEKIVAVQRAMDNPSRVERWWQDEVVPYFTGRITCQIIAEKFLHSGQIYLLDLKSGVVDEAQNAIMQELFRTITLQCIKHFKSGRGRVNAEILLDEAHRWVPQSRTENAGAQAIIDAVNTTRAYGLGWNFISQRLTGIDKNVLAQAAEKWFGKNLGVGNDRDHLVEAIGKVGMAQYEQLSLTGDYFFVGVGSQLNLGAGQSAMAIVGWSGNLTEKLIEMNPHIWRQGTWGF